MKAEEIRRVLVVGAGVMGQQIAIQCAWKSFQVSLYDISDEVLENARTRMAELMQEMVDDDILTPEEVQQAEARIMATTDPAEAARDADLLSESIPEDPKLKGKVLGQFNELCPARTVFTTNSSTLVPSQYAEATGRPALFCALHFHTYVWNANVADIMPHPGTDPEVVALLHEFARRIGQIPILVQKENPSYVFNAMLGPLLTSALTLAIGGVATIEDIDRSWMGVTKMEIGPFGIMDVVGIDLLYKITRDGIGMFRFLPRARRSLDFFESYIDKGNLGVKSGEGFYRYPDPAYMQPGFVEGD